MTTEQVATNATALRNLAARLERLGYTGDCHSEAEHIAVNLLGDGYRPLEPPIPLRPAGPVASEATRAEAKRIVAEGVAKARAKRTTKNPTDEESRP